jgi:hypothetical protein
LSAFSFTILRQAHVHANAAKDALLERRGLALPKSVIDKIDYGNARPVFLPQQPRPPAR